MAKDADALVVGAGIAGLIAARDLSRAGLRGELVEAGEATGAEDSATVAGAIAERAAREVLRSR